MILDSGLLFWATLYNEKLQCCRPLLCLHVPCIQLLVLSLHIICYLNFCCFCCCHFMVNEDDYCYDNTAVWVIVWMGLRIRRSSGDCRIFHLGNVIDLPNPYTRLATVRLLFGCTAKEQPSSRQLNLIWLLQDIVLRPCGLMTSRKTRTSFPG